MYPNWINQLTIIIPNPIKLKFTILSSPLFFEALCFFFIEDFFLQEKSF